MENTLRTHRRRVDGSIDRAFGGEPPKGLTREVLFGSAARTLIGPSDSASMLVHAHCPVLIVHTKKTDGDESSSPSASEDVNR